MAQWGRSDNPVSANSTTTKETSNGAPIGTYALVMKGGGANAHFGNTSGTRASVDVAMFGNTTAGAFVAGQAVGIFGVSATEAASHKDYAHAGWIKRTVGTGGRAGRVQTEVLVAMGSLGAQTAPYGTAANTADGDAGVI